MRAPYTFYIRECENASDWASDPSMDQEQLSRKLFTSVSGQEYS